MTESKTGTAAESAAGSDTADVVVDAELLDGVSGGLRRARAISMDDEFRQLPS